MSEEQPAPFTHFDAAIWTAGVTFVLLLVASLVHGQAERVDMVKIGAVQLAVYLLACALFSWRRPGRNFSELFAVRRTSPWLLVLCLLLGPALFGPAQTLDRVIDHFAAKPCLEVGIASRVRHHRRPPRRPDRDILAERRHQVVVARHAVVGGRKERADMRGRGAGRSGGRPPR